jgi:predicted transcriptional regulator
MPDIKSIYHGTAKTAGDIMSTKVVSCSQKDKLLDVLQQMTRYGLRRLPVLRNKEIIGELTLNQLIRKYYNATQYHPITEDEEG